MVQVREVLENTAVCCRDQHFDDLSVSHPQRLHECCHNISQF